MAPPATSAGAEQFSQPGSCSDTRSCRRHDDRGRGSSRPENWRAARPWTRSAPRDPARRRLEGEIDELALRASDVLFMDLYRVLVRLEPVEQPWRKSSRRVAHRFLLRSFLRRRRASTLLVEFPSMVSFCLARAVRRSADVSPGKPAGDFVSSQAPRSRVPRTRCGSPCRRIGLLNRSGWCASWSLPGQSVLIWARHRPRGCNAERQNERGTNPQRGRSRLR